MNSSKTNSSVLNLFQNPEFISKCNQYKPEKNKKININK